MPSARSAELRARFREERKTHRLLVRISKIAKSHPSKSQAIASFFVTKVSMAKNKVMFELLLILATFRSVFSSWMKATGSGNVCRTECIKTKDNHQFRCTTDSGVEECDPLAGINGGRLTSF